MLFPVKPKKNVEDICIKKCAWSEMFPVGPEWACLGSQRERTEAITIPKEILQKQSIRLPKQDFEFFHWPLQEAEV